MSLLEVVSYREISSSNSSLIYNLASQAQIKIASCAVPDISHVSSIAKEKYSKLAEAVFICSFKFADISSISVATVFLVNDKSLKRCALSGHKVSTVFTRKFFMQAPSV